MEDEQLVFQFKPQACANIFYKLNPGLGDKLNIFQRLNQYKSQSANTLWG